jgi:hypothetical protein
MLLSKNQEEKVRHLYRVDLLMQHYSLLNLILTTTITLPVTDPAGLQHQRLGTAYIENLKVRN